MWYTLVFHLETMQLTLSTAPLCMYTDVEHIGQSKIRLYCLYWNQMFFLSLCTIIHRIIDIQRTVRNIWHLYLVTAFIGHWKMVRRLILKHLNMRSLDIMHANYQIQILFLLSICIVEEKTINWCIYIT